MPRYYGAPDWSFMQDPPRRRRRRRETMDCPDPLETIERWQTGLQKMKERLAEDEKKKKDEGKKPPSQAEQLMGLMTWLSVMIVLGIPAGIMYKKFLEFLTH